MGLDQKDAVDREAPRFAVVVLGMHRSGTSALSGLLMKLGCDAPATLLGSNTDNPLGHFESKTLYHLQDELLDSAGTSWDDYRPFPKSWSNSLRAGEYRERLKRLLNSEFENSRFFCIKDPRICRLVPFWFDVLSEMEIRPFFVHTHRNPTEVAQSLFKRNGFDREYGYLLWLRHILDAEIGSRGQTRSFTSYDRLLTRWPTEIEKISAELGISWPKYNDAQLSGLGQMIQPDLKNNASNEMMGSKLFPSWFRDTLDVFDRWAENGEEEGDHLILDCIRRDFNESSVAFGGTVRARNAPSNEKHETAVETLTSERDAAQAQAKDRQTKAEAVIRERDAAQVRVKDGLTAIEAVTQERDAAQAQAKDRQTKAETVIRERDAAQERAETLASEKTSLTERLNFSNSMLEQRKAELDDTLAELQTMKDAVSQEKLRSADLIKDLSSMEARFQALHTAQARRAQDVGRAQKIILQHQDEIDDVRMQLAQKEQALAASSLQSSMAEEKIEFLTKTNAVELESEKNRWEMSQAALLEEGRRKDAVLKRDNAVQNEKIDTLVAHAAHLEKVVQAYAGSTSWRLTGPLRWFVMRFRK